MHNITSPDNTDRSIEGEIQRKGLTAPRITPDDLKANIVGEFYFRGSDGIDGAHLNACRAEKPDQEVTYIALTEDNDFPPFPENSLMESASLITFCVLVLKNGFTVTGESACASPENFDAEIGRRIARENAVQKVWPLMGYQLKTALAFAAAAKAHDPSHHHV